LSPALAWDMKRRDFISGLGAAAAWSLAARGQQVGKVPRVGVLSTANPRSTSFFRAFEQRMHDLGYTEGRNIAFEYRSAEGDVQKLPVLATDLVHLDVDLVVTSTELATRAMRDATATIPILMVAINYDPIALGFIESIARPGTNVTGLFFQHLDLLAKRFGLFKEMLPTTRRIAILSDAASGDQLKQVEMSNQSVGFELQPVHMENPPYDFENAFRIAMRSHAEAVFVLESASIFRGRDQIARLALDARLPTSFAFREYVEAGGLVSYGVNFSAMYRRAAEYADRILRGAKPADLPVEQSTKFDLVINQKTARAIGVVIPATLLASADEVIE
jgi:putative ABC transport system substrate-binding protein